LLLGRLYLAKHHNFWYGKKIRISKQISCFRTVLKRIIRNQYIQTLIEIEHLTVYLCTRFVLLRSSSYLNEPCRFILTLSVDSTWNKCSYTVFSVVMFQVNKKFSEELITYFPWYDMGHIENNASYSVVA
jgi:hypothetical protein